jgi:TolB-like protein
MLHAIPERPERGMWDRLRRRKVVQWGVAYAAGAWGLLQGIQYVVGTFRWSPSIQPIATLTLLVGLPIVLVLAWYHGDRGRQRVSFTELSILTLLFLLCGFMFWRYLPEIEEQNAAVATSAMAKESTAPLEIDAGPSVAVLPFVNMSGDKDTDYFSDGISEELLNALVRVDGLGVASRTSSFAYKGRSLPVADIARELRVNHVLEGSVRKAGNRVRITAQLIDAVHDRHLWSETYDRELSDIFAVQDEIANSIVAAMRGTIGRADAPARAVTVRADTSNLQAYDAYLNGRELFIARTDLQQSVRLFEHAVELDPRFARGWEGLAAVCAVIESWGIRDRDYISIAKRAAQKALDLDSSLSMPWAALGTIEGTKWPVDWAKSNGYFDRALAADPRNASAYLWRAMNWVNLGFFDKALADINRCIEIEPVYPNAVRHKAVALLYLGRTDEAIKLFEQGVQGGFVLSRSDNFVGPLVQRGQLTTAALLMQANSIPPDVGAALLAALANPDAKIPQDVENLEGQFNDIGDVARQTETHVYLWLRDFERVAATDDSATTTLVAWDRYPPGWYGSTWFKQRLQRMGVVAYWRTHGFPAQCKAQGADDFACT